MLIKHQARGWGHHSEHIVKASALVQCPGCKFHPHIRFPHLSLVCIFHVPSRGLTGISKTVRTELSYRLYTHTHTAAPLSPLTPSSSTSHKLRPEPCLQLPSLMPTIQAASLLGSSALRTLQNPLLLALWLLLPGPASIIAHWTRTFTSALNPMVWPPQKGVRVLLLLCSQP